MLAPPDRPAYLTQNHRTYVAGVLKRQASTVKDLIAAGMPEDTIRFHCEVAVERVQLLPDRIKQQRDRKERAEAALKVLNTVRAFVKELFSTDEVRFQTLDGSQSWRTKARCAGLP
jgi:hypothetical protein